RNFKGARCANDGDVVFFHAVTQQRIHRTFQQAFHHKSVPATTHNTVTAVVRSQISFDGFNLLHGIHSCINYSLNGRYSVISRSKPEMPLYFISELSRRIFLIPSSRRICEPVPMVKHAPELSLFGLRLGRARPKKVSRLSSMSSA